jgi:hypothetical protein
MNEIILAYGLGILSIGTGVLVRMVLKAEKKVISCEAAIANLTQQHERNLEQVHRRIDDHERNTNTEISNVYRNIDSRIDKLEFRMKDQFNFIKNKTSQAY